MLRLDDPMVLKTFCPAIVFLKNKTQNNYIPLYENEETVATL